MGSPPTGNFGDNWNDNSRAARLVAERRLRMAVNPILGALGLALVFALPGLAIHRAMFPERRLRGEAKYRNLVELMGFSLVVSVAITVVLGFGLLNLNPGGFAASWSDPLLEIGLSTVTVVGLGAAAWRGAFGRRPVEGPPEEPAETSSYELTLRVDDLRREARRLEHQIRRLPRDDPSRERLTAESLHYREEAEKLLKAREEELANVSS